MTYSKLVRFDYNKHLPNSYTDKSNDIFYILVALFIADQNEMLLTKLTLEKSIYTTTQELAVLNKQFFRTHFFINKLGPHNNIFYNYLEELQKASLIEINDKFLFITPKGLATMSDLLNKNKISDDIKILLNKLDEKIKKYCNNYKLAIQDTHKQKLTDTTDNNTIKTIEQVIEEIKPEERFTSSSQFKYIESSNFAEQKQVELPATILNGIENSLSNIEELDYQTNADISSLFA